MVNIIKLKNNYLVVWIILQQIGIGIIQISFSCTKNSKHGEVVTGESCLAESPGHKFEAASSHCGKKTCLSLFLSHTPLMWWPPGLPLFSCTSWQAEELVTN